MSIITSVLQFADEVLFIAVDFKIKALEVSYSFKTLKRSQAHRHDMLGKVRHLRRHKLGTDEVRTRHLRFTRPTPYHLATASALYSLVLFPFTTFLTFYASAEKLNVELVNPCHVQNYRCKISFTLLCYSNSRNLRLAYIKKWINDELQFE